MRRPPRGRFGGASASDLTHPIAVWRAALEAGYATRAAWRAWAERRIAEGPTAPAWLVDLADARSAREAAEALGEGAREARRSGLEVGGHQRLTVGFLWLLHEEGRLSFTQAIDRAGEVADAANWESPSCEAFYALAGEDASRAASLFAPFAAEAHAAWRAVLDGAAAPGERRPPSAS